MGERSRCRETKRLLRERGCPLAKNAPTLAYAEWAIANAPKLIGRPVLVENVEPKPFLAAFSWDLRRG